MKNSIQVKIREKVVLNDEVFKLKIEKPKNMNIKSGQFFQILIDDKSCFLRRPISVSKIEEDFFELSIKRVGKGTNYLFTLEKEKVLDIIGPLGNGFLINKAAKKSIIIGGGIGVSPVKALAFELKENDIDFDIYLGFRDEPFDIKDFKNIKEDIFICSENNENYNRGLIIKFLSDDVLKKYDQAYVCGPHIMIKEVNKLLMAKNIKTQLLMEERMGCGIGACLVCATQIKKEGKIRNQRVCKDGPVFDGSEVVFEI